MPDSMTQLLVSGPPGAKINVAVLGDGFNEADQSTYNSKVQALLIDGVFGHDYFYEDMSAFNIYRVNLISVDSGVSTRVYDEHGTPDDPSDDTIVSTTTRNTALGYIYSGSWAHCWLEGGPNTGSLVSNALQTWVPDYDLVLIILNNPGFGGCGGGGFQIVPLGVGWEVIAHEFGHGYGGLADEYCTSRVYSGGDPGAPNVTVNTNAATLKWNRFLSPVTPVPTGKGSCAGYTEGVRATPGWSDTHDAGLFEGGGTNATGMYRPVINCRMRGNSPEYCPVCYTVLKTKSDPRRSGRSSAPTREISPGPARTAPYCTTATPFRSIVPRAMRSTSGSARSSACPDRGSSETGTSSSSETSTETVQTTSSCSMGPTGRFPTSVSSSTTE